MPGIYLVVPCHNEARRLQTTVVESYLREYPEVHVCFVDDGSSDGTRDVLERIRSGFPGQTTVLGDGVNRGKAAAVRLGMLTGLSEYDTPLLGYWDADFATPLSELALLAAACVESPGRIAAIGSRVKRLGTQIVRRPSRHVLGRLFATCASVVLDLAIYDTQCGAKLFRRDAAEIGFREPFLSTWLFDVEVLARLRNQYGAAAVTRDILEVPLRAWADVDGSSLGAGAFLRAPLDLWRIARAYNGAASRTTR